MSKLEPKLFFLCDCISIAEDLGYKEKFQVHARGMIGEKKMYVYSPEEAKIQSHYNFITDPDKKEYSVFYLVETLDGKRGFLVDSTGDYANARIDGFVRASLQNDISSSSGGQNWINRFVNLLTRNSK